MCPLNIKVCTIYINHYHLARRLSEELRPVQLKKEVLSYPCPQAWSEFRFDISFTYKLAVVINSYSEGKPTLVSLLWCLKASMENLARYF